MWGHQFANWQHLHGPLTCHTEDDVSDKNIHPGRWTKWFQFVNIDIKPFLMWKTYALQYEGCAKYFSHPKATEPRKKAENGEDEKGGV